MEKLKTKLKTYGKLKDLMNLTNYEKTKLPNSIQPRKTKTLDSKNIEISPCYIFNESSISPLFNIQRTF